MQRYTPAVIAAAGLFLGIGAVPARAQNPGIPVHGGGYGTGITFGAVLGFSGDLSPTLKGRTVAGQATLGVGILGVTGTVSQFNPSDDAEDNRTSVGGMASLKVFGGPLIPLAAYLQAGASRTSLSSDVTQTEIPIGVGVALTIPSPAFAIKPWVAPRLQVTRLSGPGSGETDEAFAYSAGVDLTFLSGLGVHAAYDKVHGYDRVVSVGVSYGIRVRGL